MFKYFDNLLHELSRLLVTIHTETCFDKKTDHMCELEQVFFPFTFYHVFDPIALDIFISNQIIICLFRPKLLRYS